MKIARLSVARPIFTTMCVLIVLILGGVSLSRLPIDLMPDISFPTLTVATEYSNASPQEIEELITRPIEEAVAAVPGVEELTSVSSEGSSQVRVTFVWGTDLDVAANDIRDRIDRIISRLPDDADRPQLRKFDAASFPILILGASGELDPVELRQIIDEQIKYRIERVPGVAALDIWGGLARQIQVLVDPGKMQALQLTFEEISQALREGNITLPAGEIDRGLYEVSIRTPGEFASLHQLRSTVVAIRNGAPIYLHQVADVRDTHEDIDRVVRINGKPGVRLAVRKQADANTVTVAKAVLEELEQLNAEFPQVRIVPVIDTSLYIERSIDNVSQSVLFGGSLAVLVLLFFLRNLRSTFIISTAIPIAIIATFALIYFSGFTLNLMTLGGLALGVGMMVDNSIVVLESIYIRWHERKQPPDQASVEGAEHVTGAIVASTLTTLVIFLPLIFVRGMSGVMFRQLGAVIAFSLICSLLVALTLVPMLASRMLKRRPGQNPDAQAAGLSARSDLLFHRFESGYQSFLAWSLRQRGVTLLTATVLTLSCLGLVPLIGGEFMPQTDEGEVRVDMEMEVGTRTMVLDEKVRQIEEIVNKAVPEATASVTNVGGGGFRATPAAGDIRISLPPASQRDRSSEEIAAELRQTIGQVPGMTIRTRAGQGLFLLRRIAGGDSGVTVEIRGHDLQVLDALAAQVRGVLEEIPGVTDVKVSRESGAPQELIHIDRDRAADLGVSVQRIARTLESAIAGSTAGRFREDGTEIDILLRMQDARQMQLQDVLSLTVPNDRGQAVVLSNLVAVESGRGPIQIDRRNQQRVTEVSANIAGRDLLSVVRDVQQRLQEIPAPRNYAISLAGDYEDQQEAFRELTASLVLSLVLVYMVMACQYESLRDPLIVMFSVPLAGIGVVLTLFLTDTTFNVQSFIGCIMLGGIVVNNAILLVDEAGLLHRGGMSPRDAALEAGRLRLRPILMTSLTTVLGLVPLALGWGEGAEAQAPMARAVVGGLLSSMLITLVVIPALYTVFHSDRPKQVKEVQ